MRLDEIIEISQVLLCAIGYADYVVPSGYDEGQRIHFALGDDAFGCLLDAVDSPRNQFGIFFQHEMLLLDSPVLAVHQFAFFVVGEQDAFFNVFRLWKCLAGLRNGFLCHYFGRDTPVGKPLDHFILRCFLVGEATRFLVLLGALLFLLARCPVVQFHCLSEEEVFSAMVAMGCAGIPIYCQFPFRGMMLPLTMTLGAEHPLRVCMLVVTILDVDAYIFQFLVIYFHDCCFLVVFVIQTTEGRKDLGNIEQQQVGVSEILRYALDDKKM